MARRAKLTKRPDTDVRTTVRLSSQAYEAAHAAAARRRCTVNAVIEDALMRVVGGFVIQDRSGSRPGIGGGRPAGPDDRSGDTAA